MNPNQPRIVLSPVLYRTPLYRRIDWRIASVMVLSASTTAFLIWCAAKGVR
jgi:hypothetical protein